MTEITAIELKQKIDNGENPFIIDVREKIEYHTYNIGGLLCPLGKLDDYISELPDNKELEIIVVCQRGIRSRTAQKILNQAGYKNVKNLKAGLIAFNRI
ncbi:MAG: rhodanese-like domain-containing protein [bacterium]